MQGLNREGSEASDAFAAFRSSASQAVGSAQSALSAVQVAWGADLKGLSPWELRKAGVVLTRFTEQGHSEQMAIAVCRALFCGQPLRLKVVGIQGKEIRPKIMKHPLIFIDSRCCFATFHGFSMMSSPKWGLNCN